MLSFGLSLAYFTSTANSKGVSFSFAKLEVKVSTDGTNYSAETSVPLGNKTIGENIVNKVNVQLSSSSTASGFIRAKVYYSGKDEISINTAIALNSLLPATAYSSTDNYAWKLSTDGYYYLVTSGEALKSVNNANGYILFNEPIRVPDLTQFNGLALNTTNVTLNVVAEAIQSEHLKSASGAEVKSVSTLTNLITKDKIFTNVTNAGYIVNFDSKGGIKVPSIVTTNGKIKLPNVGTQSVTWYKDSALSEIAGTSNTEVAITSNTKLYAKYTANSIIVFFESGGATSTATGFPKSLSTITTTAQQIDVPMNLVRQGYTYANYVAIVNDVATELVVASGKISFTITNGKLTIGGATLTSGQAFIIKPNWVPKSTGGSSTSLIDISEATVTLYPENYYYSGVGTVEPIPKVVLDGHTLIMGTDYDVYYFDNACAGIGRVLIVGRGNYSKSKECEFIINKAEIKGDISFTSLEYYVGEVPIVDFSNLSLTDEDFSVEYGIIEPIKHEDSGKNNTYYLGDYINYTFTREDSNTHKAYTDVITSITSIDKENVGVSSGNIGGLMITTDKDLVRIQGVATEFCTIRFCWGIMITPQQKTICYSKECINIVEDNTSVESYIKSLSPMNKEGSYIISVKIESKNYNTKDYRKLITIIKGYNVNYVDANGRIIKSIKKKANDSVDVSKAVVSPPPAKYGWTFLGWNNVSTKTTALTSYTMTSSDVVMYPIFTSTNTVNFNKNADDAVSNISPISKDAYYSGFGNYTYPRATIPSTKPTRSGYTFKGWADSSTASSPNYTAGQQIELDSNKTLYAVWGKTGDVYTVTYKNGSTTLKTREYAYNDKIDVTNTATGSKPAKSGWTFIGWTDSVTDVSGACVGRKLGETGEVVFTDYLMPKKNIILYALFEKAITIKYRHDSNIVYQDTSYMCYNSANSGTTAKAIFVIKDGGGLTKTSSNEAYYYEFDYWSNYSATGSEPSNLQQGDEIELDRDITVNSHFSYIKYYKYTITFHPFSNLTDTAHLGMKINGEMKKGTTTGYYKAGETVTIFADNIVTDGSTQNKFLYWIASQVSITVDYVESYNSNFSFVAGSDVGLAFPSDDHQKYLYAIYVSSSLYDVTAKFILPTNRSVLLSIDEDATGIAQGATVTRAKSVSSGKSTGFELLAADGIKLGFSLRIKVGNSSYCNPVTLAENEIITATAGDKKIKIYCETGYSGNNKTYKLVVDNIVADAIIECTVNVPSEIYYKTVSVTFKVTGQYKARVYNNSTEYVIDAGASKNLQYKAYVDDNGKYYLKDLYVENYEFKNTNYNNYVVDVNGKNLPVAVHVNSVVVNSDGYTFPIYAKLTIGELSDDFTSLTLTINTYYITVVHVVEPEYYEVELYITCAADMYILINGQKFEGGYFKKQVKAGSSLTILFVQPMGKGGNDYGFNYNITTGTSSNIYKGYGTPNRPYSLDITNIYHDVSGYIQVD